MKKIFGTSTAKDIYKFQNPSKIRYFEEMKKIVFLSHKQRLQYTQKSQGTSTPQTRLFVAQTTSTVYTKVPRYQHTPNANSDTNRTMLAVLGTHSLNHNIVTITVSLLVTIVTNDHLH
jgi:hypothetical protein